jgi:hypothetical protein
MKKVITIVVLVTAMFSLSRAQTCDTLFNLVSNHDTTALIPADTGNAGYISGNNVYGDFALAEGFGVADSGSFVTTAVIYFGNVDINPTDTNVLATVYVWDNTGAGVFSDSAPGNAIDSAQITLGQIAQSVTENKGLLVHFTSATPVPSDTVYVGITFPTIAGDDFAVLTNTFNGPDGNGWVLGYDPSASQTGAITWNSYNDNYGVTTGSIGNYIGISLCNAPNANPQANFGGGVSNNSCNPAVVTVNDASPSPPKPTSFTWIFGDGNTANGPNATDVYTTPGAYLLTELVSCDTGSVVEVFVAAQTQVTVYPSPVVTPTATQTTGNTATGSASVTVVSPTGNYFVYWLNQGDTVGEGNALQGIAPGLYIAEVNDQDGCTVFDSILVDSIGTGILQLSANQQVKVYPNPATDVLNLVWSQQSNAEISVVDLNGNLISSMNANGDMKTVYDIHNLASGAYILRITDKDNNQQQSMLFTKF